MFVMPQFWCWCGIRWCAAQDGEQRYAVAFVEFASELRLKRVGFVRGWKKETLRCEVWGRLLEIARYILCVEGLLRQSSFGNGSMEGKCQR
jgi:hypothetical protein